MADLSTTYMGLKLKNPVVPSASPLSREIDGIRALEDAGASAVVLYSLFEEQISIETGEFSPLLTDGSLSLASASAHFPQKQEYSRDPDNYVEHVRKAKEAVDIPIIASMNGTSVGGWLDYARKIEQAGADGLELNVYFIPTTDILFGLDIETLYLDILRAVTEQVSIPVAVKLSPFFSALPNFASRLSEGGADALVLFNRFYQPDIDVDSRSVNPNLVLSRPEDILLPLRWIAILYGQVDSSMALTTGVHSGKGVMKAILAGADIACVCSVLLKGKGIEPLKRIIADFDVLVEVFGETSLEDLRGSLSLTNHVEPAAFERASYIKLLQGFGRI